MTAGGTLASDGPSVSTRRIYWAAGIGVVSFVVLLLSLAFGSDLTLPETAEPNSYSYSALGHRALVEFLREQGVPVFVRRSYRKEASADRSPLLVIEPQLEELGEDEESCFRKLRAEANSTGAPLVVVLPKWQGKPAMTDKGRWVQAVQPLPLQRLENLCRRLLEGEGYVTREETGDERVRLECQSSWGGAGAAEMFLPQLLSEHPDWEPVLWCDRGRLIARRTSAQGLDLYLVSDPDLLNNAGLGRADHPALIQGFFHRQLRAQSAVFDETVHGYLRDLSFLAELLRFPLVLIVLHGVLVLAMAFWAGMRRIGKPVPDPSRGGEGKQVMIDNTASLLAYQGDIRDSLDRYFKQTLRAVARGNSIPTDSGMGEIQAQLQRLTEIRGIEINLEGVRRSIHKSDGDSVERDRKVFHMAGILHRWRQEMNYGS